MSENDTCKSVFSKRLDTEGRVLPSPVTTTKTVALQKRHTMEMRRQRMVNACIADWNTLHDEIGSFADEHVIL